MGLREKEENEKEEEGWPWADWAEGRVCLLLRASFLAALYASFSAFSRIHAMFSACFRSAFSRLMRSSICQKPSAVIPLPGILKVRGNFRSSGGGVSKS